MSSRLLQPGFLVKKIYVHPSSCYEQQVLTKVLQICKPYTTCLTGLHYTKVDGRATGDRDNVCVKYTRCRSGQEYELSAPSPTVDRVCVAYTVCDSQTEYLLGKVGTASCLQHASILSAFCKCCCLCCCLLMIVLEQGNATSDNVCARKTFCASGSFRARYQKVAPIDSTAWNVPGKDAQCANVTTCPPGKYVYIGATDTSDVTCEKCPIGMYKAPGMLSCSPCPAGTYADVLGSTSCKQCTDCLLLNSSTAAGEARSKFEGNDYLCPFANASLCRMAFKSMCTREADAMCMQCPSAEKASALLSGEVCAILPINHSTLTL